VICRRCPTRIDDDGSVRRQGGGFSAGHGILICANEMRSRSHLEDTLAHEMVHAWDSLRWKVKEGDLRHAACTEVCSFLVLISYVLYRLKMDFDAYCLNDDRSAHQPSQASVAGHASSSREETGT